MALRVEEIMNREIYAAKIDDEVDRIRRDLIHLGVSGAPVLDDEGRPLGVVSLKDLVGAEEEQLIVDRISCPAMVVYIDTPIESAGRLMAETGCHRLIVVDGERAVGMIGTLDVMRALIGMPASHPATFPHYDVETGATWTDDHPLDWAHVEAAPAGPGVLLILNGGVGRAETIVWGETADDVRSRLMEYLEAPKGGPTVLSYWKAIGDLRFRAAAVEDPDTRPRVLESAMA